MDEMSYDELVLYIDKMGEPDFVSWDDTQQVIFLKWGSFERQLYIYNVYYD